MITEISRTVGMRSDARDVAMSHVFSVLDNAMGSVKRNGGRERAITQQSSGKDSWIDEERRFLATRASADEEEEFDGRTPRSRARKELPREEGKGKGKQAVHEREKDLQQEPNEAQEREDKRIDTRKVSDADREGSSFFRETNRKP